MKFIDLDAFIAEREQSTIPDIFKTHGEVYFRKKEMEYLRQALDTKGDVVLGTGGGTPCFGTNMQVITAATPNSIYLQMGLNALLERLMTERAERPLLAKLPEDEIPDYIAKHLFERSYFYNQARIHLKADGKTVAQLVKRVTAELI